VRDTAPGNSRTGLRTAIHGASTARNPLAGIRLGRILASTLFLLGSSAAKAQVSMDAGLASDNVYRGISLNDEAAAPALNLAWDGQTGWYANAFASSVRFYRHAHSSAQVTADVGFARGSASGTTWELGAIAAVFPGATQYNYAETFVGLLGQDWNARVYFSPDYFGRSRRTLYTEFNYTHPLGKRWRLFGHGGALQYLSHPQTVGGTRLYDIALGTGVRLDRIDLQLRWVDTSRQEFVYPVNGADRGQEWVTSVTFSF
jgi:uncharacterized protein (TIGR02001 family)